MDACQTAALTAQRTAWMAVCACLVVFVTNCGGSTPTGPTRPPAATQASWTISGQALSTVTGAPLVGVQLAAGGSTTTTDQAGRYTLVGTSAGDIAAIALSGAGILTRDALIKTGTRENVALDAISTAAPFSLELYREMVHNGKDAPSGLVSVRRWETPPTFYIVTTHGDGSTIPSSEIDRVAAVIRHTVGQWTAGAFGPLVTSVATDPGSPNNAVVVRFVSSIPGGLDGRATVGEARGWVELRYPNSFGCVPEGSQLEFASVAHEIGHALGFFHHNGTGLMGPRQPRVCHTGPTLSDAEQFHAAIAYARPRGNVYPDKTPASAPLRETHQVSIVID